MGEVKEIRFLKKIAMSVYQGWRSCFAATVVLHLSNNDLHAIDVCSHLYQYTVNASTTADWNAGQYRRRSGW